MPATKPRRSGRAGPLEAWEEAGRPLTVTYPNGVETIAPLYKVLVDAARHADKLFRSLPRHKRMDRPPVAVVTPLANRRITGKASSGAG